MYPTTRRLQRGGPPAAGLAALTLILAACGAGGSSAYGAGGYGAAPVTPSAAGSVATVDLRDSSLGQIVVGAQGRTLYLFEADKGGKSTCDGPCASVWPPYLGTGTPQSGTPQPGIGASAALIGTTTRGDGGTQVTYGGHPLYYYVGDKAPGDVTGQDLDQFGAKWYVLDKDGKKIDND